MQLFVIGKSSASVQNILIVRVLFLSCSSNGEFLPYSTLKDNDLVYDTIKLWINIWGSHLVRKKFINKMPAVADFKIDSAQSSSNKCKNYLLKIYS